MINGASVPCLLLGANWEESGSAFLETSARKSQEDHSPCSVVRTRGIADSNYNVLLTSLRLYYGRGSPTLSSHDKVAVHLFSCDTQERL